MCMYVSVTRIYLFIVIIIIQDSNVSRRGNFSLCGTGIKADDSCMYAIGHKFTG